MDPLAAKPSETESERIDRLATRLAGGAASVLAIAFLLEAALFADWNFVWIALGPGVAAALALLMVKKDRNQPHVIVVVGLVATTASYTLFGQFDSTPALISLALVTTAGALLMPPKWKWPYVVAGGLELLTIKALWDGISPESVWTGIAGGVIGVAAMILLIRVRDGLIASNRRYQALVEHLPVPLIEQDWSQVRRWLGECRRAGVTDIVAHMDAHPEELIRALRTIRVRGVNPAIVGLVGPDGLSLGINQDTTYGITHESMAPFVLQEILGMWDGTGPLPGDYVMRRTRGDEFWARLQAADITDESIPGVDRVIVATDVTELKSIQAELGHQLRSKDEFIAAVSHELRTPLTSVIGFADLMRTDSANLSPAQLEMLEHLSTQAHDMAHIVEDLLVAARAEVGSVVLELSEFALTSILDPLLADFGADFHLSCDADPIVRGDRTRVGQILRNLMTNAHRYGGDCRSIRISKGGPFAIVEVKDTGPGIPLEDHERVFEPYVRAHDRPGMAASVGLGLTVSRQLAELMGGSVDYLREDGETIFRLTLPIALVGSDR